MTADGRQMAGDPLERARERVAGRLADGVYTREEIERVSGLALVLKEKRDFGLDVDEGVAWLHANWDPTRSVEISSHRRLAGKVIVPAKRLLWRLLRPLARLMLLKQTEFNAHATHLLTVALNDLRDRMDDRVEQRLDTLLVSHHRLQAEHDRLARRAREEQAERLRQDAVERAREAGETGGVTLEERRGGDAEAPESPRDYLAYLGRRQPVLDAGCGEGAFLEHLRSAGIAAWGVDTDGASVGRCLEKGLDARREEMVAHLASLPDASLGGIVSLQVVERLSTADLNRFFAQAFAKLAPGGCLLVETVNPTCLCTFADTFYLDLARTRPIHPESLRFLAEAGGFAPVELLMRSPVPPESKLRQVDIFHRAGTFEDAFLNTVNDNFNRLNELLWGYRDYVVVAWKPEVPGGEKHG
jgi:O-antigen chain-terminating methyltransferase